MVDAHRREFNGRRVSTQSEPARRDIDFAEPFPYIRALLVKPPDATVRAPEN
jgi:hypothetical protein